MKRVRTIVKHWNEPIGHYSIQYLTLDSLQKIVGGYIEAVTIAPKVVILCDEEGRLKGKPYNCTVNGISFVGDIIVVGTKGEEFTQCPIALEDWKEVFLGVRE